MVTKSRDEERLNASRMGNEPTDSDRDYQVHGSFLIGPGGRHSEFKFTEQSGLQVMGGNCLSAGAGVGQRGETGRRLAYLGDTEGLIVPLLVTTRHIGSIAGCAGLGGFRFATGCRRWKPCAEYSHIDQ